MLNPLQLETLIVFRHELHSYPEVSGAEVETRERVKQFLIDIAPSVQIVEAGKGLLVIFEGEGEGPTTLIRAELDALPIQEINEMPYKSQRPGISHKCGHDGHMCMVIGLAYLLEKKPPQKGKVVLLFQSAEETGQGAQWMLTDPKFTPYKPDYAFSMHNLPGLPIHEITCRAGTFCAASTGIKIKMQGKTAHASSPETGNSPVTAISQLSATFNKLVETNEFTDFTLLTVTHLQVGEPTFGISPGVGELRLTIRAYQDKDLEKLKQLIKKEVEDIAGNEGLTFEVTYHESFAATVNNSKAVVLIKETALTTGLNFTDMALPNPWSEDFGLFLHGAKGAMFGLGSGIDQPALHNPDYDFPDELIATGTELFWGLIQRLNYYPG